MHELLEHAVPDCLHVLRRLEREADARTQVTERALRIVSKPPPLLAQSVRDAPARLLLGLDGLFIRYAV